MEGTLEGRMGWREKGGVGEGNELGGGTLDHAEGRGMKGGLNGKVDAPEIVGGLGTSAFKK